MTKDSMKMGTCEHRQYALYQGGHNHLLLP